MAIHQRILEQCHKALSLIFVVIITFYRTLISPLIGPRCRFYPTCSEYALLAIKTNSLPKALWLISKRLLKCHPLCSGGYDPLPTKKAKP